MEKGKESMQQEHSARPRQGLSWTAAVVGIGMLAASCGREQPNGGQSRRAEPAPIRFSYQNRIGSAIPIIAVEKGIFARHSLKVVPSRFTSGPACAEALYTGAADVGAMGDTTAIIALSRAAPLQLIASHASGEHRHRLIVSAESSLKTVQDLGGKRVAIKKGTSTYGGFLKFLAANEIPPDRITVVNLKPEAMPDALAAGSVEAFAASEPTPSLGEMRGGRQIATFGGMGNTYPIMMLATESFIAERPAELARFVAALQEAERFTQANRGEAVSVIAKSIGMPDDITAKALDRHTIHLNLDAATLDSLRETAAFLKSEGLIEALPELVTAGPLSGEAAK